MRKIIGFGCRRRTGKDAAASALRGSGYETLSFAHALKCVCEIVTRRWSGEASWDGLSVDIDEMHARFGLPAEWLYAFVTAAIDGRKALDVVEDGKYRYLLQWAGTDFFRARDPDVWVNVVRHELAERPNTSFAITDVRFPNEAAMLCSVGGLLVRVDREQKHSQADVHVSEVALQGYDGFNCVINNNGSLEELHAKARIIDRYFEAFQFCRNAEIFLPRAGA